MGEGKEIVGKGKEIVEEEDRWEKEMEGGKGIVGEGHRGGRGL